MTRKFQLVIGWWVRNFMCVWILEPPAGYKYISVVMTDGRTCTKSPKTVLYISRRKLSVQGQVKSRDPEILSHSSSSVGFKYWSRVWLLGGQFYEDKSYSKLRYGQPITIDFLAHPLPDCWLEVCFIQYWFHLLNTLLVQVFRQPKKYPLPI